MNLCKYSYDLEHLQCEIRVQSNKNLFLDELYDQSKGNNLFQGEFVYNFEPNFKIFIDSHRREYKDSFPRGIVTRLYNREGYFTYYKYCGNQLIFVSNKRYPLFAFRRKIAFLIDTINPNVHLVHGCGIVWNQQGILFVGASGSGKSTILNGFAKNKDLSNFVIDDDLNFYTEKGLLFASSSRNILNYKILNQQPNTAAKLKILFLLNKDFEGGYYKKIRSTIKRSKLIDNTIPLELKDLYLNKPEVVFDAVVFEIGTNAKEPKTIKLVTEIINDH